MITLINCDTLLPQALHFSPALHEYVTKELNKPLILVLNKIDLAPPALVTAWRHYFREKYPELPVVMFTSFPKDTSDNDAIADPGKGNMESLNSVDRPFRPLQVFSVFRFDMAAKNLVGR